MTLSPAQKRQAAIKKFKRTGKCDLCNNTGVFEMVNPCAPRSMWDREGNPPREEIPCPLCRGKSKGS